MCLNKQITFNFIQHKFIIFKTHLLNDKMSYFLNWTLMKVNRRLNGLLAFKFVKALYKWNH